MKQLCKNYFLHTQSASTLIKRTMNNGDMAAGGAEQFS